MLQPALMTRPQGKPLCLGIVTAPHGVRGAVRVRSFTEDPRAIGSYGPLTDDTGARAFKLRVQGVVKGSVIAEIDGVTDRDQAEALRGLHLHVAREQLPEADEDEFYHADLIGLAAFLATGEVVGSVIAVHDFGAGPSLEIARDTGADFLVPFTHTAVPVVDLASGRVVIEALPGLLDRPGPPRSLDEQTEEAFRQADEGDEA